MRSSSRRFKRFITVGVLLALLVGAVTEPASASQLGMRSTVSLSSLVSSLGGLLRGAGSSVWPSQRRGSTTGAVSRVSVASTRSGKGNGSAPGAGKGALARFAPVVARVTAGKSGVVRTGFDPRTSVQVPSKGSAFATWFENADGTHTRKISQSPVNYRDASGNWQPIQTGLVWSSTGLWTDRANAFSVSFGSGKGTAAKSRSLSLLTDTTATASPTASASPSVSASPSASTSTSSSSSELATVDISSSESVAWSLSGAAAVTPVVSGDTAVYSEILPSTTLKLTSETYGVKESIVLASASAGNSWTFPLSMTGVSLAENSDGVWQLLDSSGVAVAALGAPWAEDSNVNAKTLLPATTHDVSYSLATVNGVQELTMTLSSSWLNDSARVFPVTVDPTLDVSINGTVATNTVQSGDGGAVNYSGSPWMGMGSSAAGIERSFLYYPQASLVDTGYHVTAASFRAFMIAGQNYASAYQHFYVNAVTSSWTPDSALTYPGPSFDTTPMGEWQGIEGSTTTCIINGSSTSGKWTYTDIGTTTGLSYFNSWSTKPASTAKYHGIALTGYSETDGSYWMNVASSQSSGCSPYLYLTYTADVAPQIDSMSPVSGESVYTLRPTLSATGQDSDSWPPNTAVTYQFGVYSGATGALVAESGSQTGTSWKVPAGVLKWGKSYTWRVLNFDGVLYSTYKYNMFTVTASPPLLTSGLSQNADGHGYSASIGNYTTSAVDAKVATVGPALEMKRDYNSLDPRRSGAFGAGWSSVLDAKASQVLDGDHDVVGALITYPDGSQVPFGLNADGTTYAPPQGRFASVTFASGSGSGYTLIDKQDTTYSFTHTQTAAVADTTAGVYQLSSITDAAGRKLTFAYSASTGGQVTSVTSSASGRSLYVSWSQPSGATSTHVTSVTAGASSTSTTCGSSSTSLIWSYTYTGDKLTGVCTPAGNQTTYAYTSGSQYQSAVLDTAPRSYWPLGEAAGATSASSAVLANEQADAGTYSSVSSTAASGLAGSTGTAAVFDGSASYVGVPAGLIGAGPVSWSVSLWFKTTGSSEVLFSHSESGIGSATTTGYYQPSLYVGADGKLVGGVGIAGVLYSSAKVNDNLWHHAVLTESASNEALYVDGKQVGTGTAHPDTTAEVNTRIGTGFLGGGWPDESSSGVSAAPRHYFNGAISDVAFYDRAITGVDVANLHTIGTNSTALLTQIKKPSGAVQAAVAYNMVTGRVSSVTDENGGTWKLSAPAVTGSSQVYRAAVLGSEAAYYWRLGDLSGASAAANEVNSGSAAYNSVTLGSTGVFSDETTGTFDGSTSYVALPSALIGAGSQTFTVSMWFKTTGTTQVLFSHSADALSAGTTSGNYQPLYIGSDGKLIGGVGPGGAIKTSVAENDGKWHQVVFTESGTSTAMYVDGSQVGTGTASPDSTAEPHDYVGTGFLGGNWPDEANQGVTARPLEYFAGSIGEVAFWRSSVTADQASALYSAAGKSAGIAPVETVKVTDPGLNTLTYRYDPENSYRPVTTTDGRGYTTTYGYDTGGFLDTVTDPNGNTVTTQHDVRGNQMTKTTCQDTQSNKCSTEWWLYYPDDTTAILTTPSATNDLPFAYYDGRSSGYGDGNHVTNYFYDSKGDRTNVVTPPVTGYAIGRSTATLYTDGTSVLVYGSSTVYAPAGLPYQVTTPGGAVTATTYYADGDVATVTDPMGKVTLFTYDGFGRVVSKTVTWGSTSAVTSYTYDGDGHVLTETDPATTDLVTSLTHQKVTTSTYVNGLLSEQVLSDAGTGTDASRATSYSYNSLDQVSLVTDPKGNTTGYTYDGYGNKVTVTDGAGNVTAYTYDADGYLTKTVLKNYTGDPVSPSTAADLTLESRVYDSAGRLAWVTDSMGWITKYTYADNGLTASVVRTDGTNSYTTKANTYDDAGNLIARVTNNGATTTDYTVDAANRVTAMTVDPSGVDRVTAYTYNGDDQVLTKTVTASGTSLVTTNTWYTGGGLKSQAVSGDGTTRTTSWVRDQRNLATSMTNADTKTTTYTYDALGQLAGTTLPSVTSEVYSTSALATVSLPSTPTTLTGYDTFGEKAETQDPVGNRTTYTYYADGTIAAITGASYTPTGSSTAIVPIETRTYDGDRRVLTDVSPKNETTTYTYDQLGDVAKTVDGRTGVTHATYDTNKEKLTSASPAGTVTAATYDYLGRKVTSSVKEVARSGEVETTHYAYKTGGWLASQTSPAGAVTSYGYDNLGEKTSVTDGASNTTTYSYDGFGRVAKTLLPDNTYTTKTYDALGDVTATTAYNSSGVKQWGTSATYDAMGHDLTSTDALTYVTSYSYDDTGLLTGETQPVTSSSSISVSYGYDLAGHKTRYTDGRSNNWYWTYDTLGKTDTAIVPATSSYPSSTATNITTSYTYDADGQVATKTLPGGVAQTYTYDGNGDVNSETGTGADATTAARVFSYDGDGNVLTAQTCTDTTCGTVNTTETFTYNSEGELWTAAGTAGTTTNTYNADGQLATRADAAGTTTYTYDTARRLSTLADPATAVTDTYTYNTLSQPYTITYGSGGDVRTYSYDASHRLTKDALATSGGTAVAAISYGYDAAGQVTSKTDLAGTANTYTYDQAGRLHTWSDGTTSTQYGYDGASNRTSVAKTTIATSAVTSNLTNTYDNRNELTSTADSVASTSTAFTYTARGTRASAGTSGYTFDAYGQQIIAGANTYTYDAAGRATTVTNPTTTALKYSGAGNTLASDGTNTYTHDTNDQPVAVSESGTGYALWTDIHTDVAAVFAPAGTALSGVKTYDPAGTALTSTGTTTTLGIGYQSGYTDTSTGDVNMAARWYSPTAGQFTSQDTITTSATPDTANGNLYGYADASPLNYADPSGHGLDLLGDVNSIFDEMVAPLGDLGEMAGGAALGEALGVAGAALSAPLIGALAVVGAMGYEIYQYVSPIFNTSGSAGNSTGYGMQQAAATYGTSVYYAGQTYILCGTTCQINLELTALNLELAAQLQQLLALQKAAEQLAQLQHLSAEGRTPHVQQTTGHGNNPVDVTKHSKGPKLPSAATASDATAPSGGNGGNGGNGAGGNGGGNETLNGDDECPAGEIPTPEGCVEYFDLFHSGRFTPKPGNINEQIAMDEVMADPANGDPIEVRGGMQDARWSANNGWGKMEQIVNDVKIHYVRNSITGAVGDFKFVD